MSITIVRSLPEEEWRRFVEQHPAGNIFHTPEMFQVFAAAKSFRPEFWAAVKGERVLALLLPVQITLMNGLARYFTTRAVVYGSILCAQEDEAQQALSLLLHTYRSHTRGTVLFTELRNMSDLSPFQPTLQDNGFCFHDHVNYLIDLQGPAGEVWQHIDGKARTNIRKAIRRGVVIEDVTSPDKLSILYSILLKTYRRVGVPLAPPSLFDAAFEILGPRGIARMFLARVEGTYIGASVRLLYKDVIFAWYAGSIRDYVSYGTNDLLNWHIMEFGAQNGFKYFDFGGGGDPHQDYGPRTYKAKFGGTLVNYGRNLCIHAPVRLKLSQVAYQLARRLLWTDRK